MREAYHGKEILKDDDENFYGINLGYDYCAEHEFGLKELEYALGINKDLIGIEGRKQTSKGRYVTCSFTKNKEKWVGLAFVENYYNTFENKKEIKDFILSRVYLCNDKVLTSAWDSKGFEIVVPIKYQYIIDELAQALENNQLVIGIGGSVNPFSRGG